MAELQCPLLAGYDRAFAAATRRFEQLVAPLDAERAGWSPDPRTWSVAACLDHLNRSSTTYFEQLAPALDRAREAGLAGGAPYGRGTWVGRFLLGVLDPLRPRFKAVKAPKVFRPAVVDAIDFDAACEEFRAVQERWHAVLRQADGLPLGEVKLATPVSRLLKVTAHQAILIHVFHEPRHLGQAERVVQHREFPSDRVALHGES
jgi:hypothetical protein